MLVFGAATLELRRPRAGWPVLALLGLAGLLRPEAWVLAGVYWLWLIPATPRKTLAWLALLVAVPPLLWMLADVIVVGEPLYSLTKTREVAGEFGRQRGIGAAIRLIPDYAAGNDKVVTVGVGGLGLLLALYLLRRRALLAVALGGLGVATFLAIAAAGLSVIPRYLTIPSILLSLCVAVALTGWTLTSEPRARAVAIGVAILSVLVIGWRAPAYLHDFHVLNGQSQFVEQKNTGLQKRADQPQGDRGARALPADHDADPLDHPDHPLRDGAAQGGAGGVDRPAAAADRRAAVRRQGLQLRPAPQPLDRRRVARIGPQAVVEPEAARVHAHLAQPALEGVRRLPRRGVVAGVRARP